MRCFSLCSDPRAERYIRCMQREKGAEPPICDQKWVVISVTLMPPSA